MSNSTDELIKKLVVSQPSTRKSRSISRYFLGNKRSSIDGTTQDHDIHRCLISVGIFDSYDLWTYVTLFRDYTTCRRLFILTNQNELIIGKCHPRQFLFKIKHRIDLTRLWFYTNVNDCTVSEITSLNYYDTQRSLIIGWPLAENYLVEFDNTSLREIWKDRFHSILHTWWQLNHSNIEHVRIVIDQNYKCDQNNNSASFLIRKVIGIRPQETVRDLIKKCIDAFHLRDPFVDNYVLFVTNLINPSNSNASSQAIPVTNIPLIGHEYPYSIKMKHLKAASTTLTNNRSFDGDDCVSYQTHHNNSSTSLTNVATSTYHDFELRKRDTLTDTQTKKHRFFHKRKTKTQQQQQLSLTDEYHSSSTPYLSSPNPTKIHLQVFGRAPDELLPRYNYQLPPIIMKLLEILYSKGPETTGIFRKVANTRSVKDCVEKIERNIPLEDDDLHPILAAGIFKHFLRTLPDPLFNSIQYDNWKKCLRLPTTPEKISFARKNILSTLSEANHILLKGFICILHRISDNADVNGMNPFNLGLCVSNSLFKTESTTIKSGKQEADVMSSIIEFLIENCSLLFGADILTCIADKHILIHPIPHLTRPTASSIESLDEVESSPHLPVINRSHDSGLAASDQPFNDDSSEVSEHFRRHTASFITAVPDWTSSIAFGKGMVLTSVLINNTSAPITTITSVARRRSSKYAYKPSKQFLERGKLTNNTTDDSDNNSSLRSSATTIHNLTIGKIKRSKSLSRHSSLGSGEHKQQKQVNKESRRLISNDVKRTSSLKQFHHSSDEAGDDDDERENHSTDLLIHQKRTNTGIIEENFDGECLTTRSVPCDQHHLDLTSEPLKAINQRLTHTSALSTPTRTTSFTQTTNPPRSNLLFTQPIIGDDNRSRHNSRFQHLGQSQPSALKTQRDRTFVHRCDTRPFVLSTAIQMKPIDDRTRSHEHDRQSRISTPVIIHHDLPSNVSRYQSIERRLTSQPMRPFSFDIHNELQLSDISWSVREKAKLFEHTSQQKLSTGRENYV